jgi:ABC-type sulfate transport system permease subunit
MKNSPNSNRASNAYPATDWRAAVWAGVIAGIIFMMIEMLMVKFFMGESPWGPPRMMAAMVLGKDVLPPPATFDLRIMMTAMMIHLPLSIVYGLILGWAVHRFSNTVAIVIAVLLGLAIYLINFYLVAPLIFPWFTQAQNWVSLVSHLMFGLILGGAYAGLRRPSLPSS